MLTEIVHWLTTDWSGGYLCGAVVSYMIFYAFRAEDRATQRRIWVRKEMNFIVATAGRMLVKHPEHEAVVMTMASELLALRPDERVRLEQIMREITEELKQ